MTDNIDWGLAACGSSGTVSIDIEQTCSGPEMWQATIDINSFRIRFSINGPRDVIDFFEFLRGDKSKRKKQIGTIGNGTVSARNDDEFDDRIFFH